MVDSATYRILKAQSIQFSALPRTISYGAKQIVLWAQASSGLPVKFSVISGPGKLSGNTLSTIGVGSIIVAASQPGNSEYAPAKAIRQTIPVVRAKLTVTATSFSIEQGQPVPKLTYAIKGFVNGDTQSKDTSGQPDLELKGASGSERSIVITQGTLKAKNYDFTFVNGKVTVK